MSQKKSTFGKPSRHSAAPLTAEGLKADRGKRKRNKNPISFENSAVDNSDLSPVPLLRNAQQHGEPRFALDASRQFTGWLAEQGASIAFSTYQAGMLMFLSVNDQGNLAVFNRHLERLMGLAKGETCLYAASVYQLHRFENALPRGEKTSDGYDRAFVPQVSYTTGDIDIHDIGILHDGRPIFVSSLFSCLATASETHSLKPVWTPPWISRLAAEDRCHLNGLAMRDGKPAYVTAVARSDVADGWRDHRADGGVVVDVASKEIIAGGLSMPHSPRWYRDRLWVHDSGTGRFGYIESESGRFEAVSFCPGYLRGLDFIGEYAVMGLSMPRDDRAMSGLILDETLREKAISPRCALYVVNINTGDVAHWVRIEGVIKELFDVAILPDCKRPMAVGFKSDEIRRVLSIEDPGPLGSLGAD